MRYDVLLCDADNTLFDFTKAEENAFAIACEGMGFSATPELLHIYSEINEGLWKLLEQGTFVRRPQTGGQRAARAIK